MKLDDDQKRAVKDLGDAINKAVEVSDSVSQAIEQLRDLGYEPNLNLKLEIALQEIAPLEEDPIEELDVEFTEDDLRTLKRMKIAAD